MRSAITRKDDAESAIEAARVIRRLELFRIVVADLVGEIDAAAVGSALTDLAEALIEAGLYVATKAVGLSRGTPVPADIAVIGMGRFGGVQLAAAAKAGIDKLLLL